MNCLGEDARDLLRKCAVFGRGAPAQRFFQFVRHVGANENSFTIRHWFGLSFWKASKKLQLRPIEKRVR